MSGLQDYSDEKLVAFLDGELPAKEIASLTQEVATSSALALRLRELDIDRSSLRIAFDQMLLQAPVAPASVNVLIQETARPASLRREVLVAGLAAVCGLLAGWWVSSPGTMTWQQQASSYHALYGPETLAAITVEKVVAEAELARVSAAIGKDLQFGKLSATPNLAYKRAQVLRFGSKPLAQLAFVAADGGPVALCIMPDGAEPQGLVHEAMSGLSTVRWSAAGFSYILIGPAHAHGLNDLAVALQQAIGV